jgi:hypothetical protein
LLDSWEGSDDPGIDEAWRQELRLRKAMLRDGSVVPSPWSDARARLSAL